MEINDLIRRMQAEIDAANIKLIESKAEIARLTAVIESRHGTVAGLIGEVVKAEMGAPAKVQGAATGNPRDWLTDGSLIYRLSDNGVNCDEINITMVHGSRGTLEREAAAAGLLNLICASDCAASEAPPLPVPNLKDGFLYQEGLDIKAVLYTDNINGQQVCRDNLWLATTEALNKLAEVPAAPPLPAPTGPLYEEQPDGTITQVDQSDRFPPLPAPSKAAEGSIGDDPQFEELTLAWIDAAIAYRRPGASRIPLMNAYDAMVQFIDQRPRKAAVGVLSKEHIRALLTNEQIRKILHHYSRLVQPGYYSDTEFSCLQDVIAFARNVIESAIAAQVSGQSVKQHGSGE